MTDDTISAYPFLNVQVSADLGDGADMVQVQATEPGQVRLSFTSAEVGNGTAMDAGTMTNQDGGLAVRMQAEDAMGATMASTSRFDDEGIRFVAARGVTFDVRDLVSGVQRGDQFSVVELGTLGADVADLSAMARGVYVNAGQSDDVVTGGRGRDFLVGGAGNDMLSGGDGRDSLLGGGGADTLMGGEGGDLAIYNASTDGADQVDLGTGSDTVAVTAPAGAQVRLMFTSAEVGNGMALDAGTLANQDGGLALRLSLEDAAGTPGATVARFDDEGIRFTASAGATFDVRDLVSGVERGNVFSVVSLGTSAGDKLNETAATLPVYVNAGAGDDVVVGGMAGDFLVGGAGNDTLIGGQGADSLLGGGGDDLALVDTRDAMADRIDLGDGKDTVLVSAAQGGQIRMTFTSAEVGNAMANDAGTLANQDGMLAVRLQAEDMAGMTTGATGRFDDEGIRFVARDGATFDVRDLVSGAARGDGFKVVDLGTLGADRMVEAGSNLSIYANAGQGDDLLRGGMRHDFLVGGAGNDTLSGNEGRDTLLGGGGNDVLTGGDGADVFLFVGSDGTDVVTDFTSGSDVIDLRAFGIDDADIEQVMVSAGLRLNIDRTGDGISDLSVILAGTTMLEAGDILF